MRPMQMTWITGGLALALTVTVLGCGDDDNFSSGAGTALSPTPIGASSTATPTVTCPIPDATPTDEEQFGAVVPSADDVAQGAKCLAPAALAVRTGSATPPPQATIPATALPPVQEQGTAQHLGSPGSCEVWSAGYAMGSYTANLTNQRPIADLANTVSAGFLYPWVLNQEGKSCGMGTTVNDTLDYLVSNTAPSLAAVPYSPSCACLDMVDVNQTFMTDLAIGSWCYLPSASGGDVLAAIKGWVAQGHVVQTSIFMPWELPDYTGGVYDVPTGCPTPAPTPTKPTCAQHGAFACIASTTTGSGCAQHGVAIVGYDDNKIGPDGKAGAVLIMNSFGTDWGKKGFMWMSYESLASIYLAGTLAFPPQPSGGLGAPAAVADAFQWVEQRAGEVPRTHLIVETAFAEALPDAEVTITAPEGRRARHHYAQPFRHGYVYFTRHDGKQFEAGMYAVEMRSSNSATLTANVRVELDTESDLPPAPLPDDLTGSNGQPATLDP
jgi:hypothetical protein